MYLNIAVNSLKKIRDQHSLTGRRILQILLLFTFSAATVLCILWENGKVKLQEINVLFEGCAD